MNDLFTIEAVTIHITDVHDEVHPFLLEQPNGGAQPFQVTYEEDNIRPRFRDINLVLRKGSSRFRLRFEYSYQTHLMDLRPLLMAKKINLKFPPSFHQTESYQQIEVHLQNQQAVRSYMNGLAMDSFDDEMDNSSVTLEFLSIESYTWDEMMEFLWSQEQGFAPEPPDNLSVDIENEGDDFFDFVMSLAEFSSDFSDVKGKIWTPQGGASVSSNIDLVGGGGVLLSGSSSQFVQGSISSDFDLGSGDFCIEIDIYPNELNRLQYIFRRPHSSGYIFGGWILAQRANNQVFFQFSTGSVAHIISGGTVLLNQRNHIRVSCASNIFKMFLNGIEVGSLNTSATRGAGNVNSEIGRDRQNTTRNYNGFINNFRFTKGVSRSATNEIVPDDSYPVLKNDFVAILSWDAVSGVNGYNVYLKSNSQFEKENQQIITDTSYQISDLDPGMYEAYVTSVLILESEPSDIIGFQIDE